MTPGYPPLELKEIHPSFKRLEQAIQAELILALIPKKRLRAMMKISEAVGNILDLDVLLPRILDSLFEVFPQADTGFFVFKEETTTETNDLIPFKVHAEKFRSSDDEPNMMHSSTIIQRALKMGEAVLSANVQDDTRFRSSDSIPELSIRSMMCVPLLSKAHETIGVIELDTKNFAQEFGSSDLELSCQRCFPSISGCRKCTPASRAS